jgi:hypothetical protein
MRGGVLPEIHWPQWPQNSAPHFNFGPPTGKKADLDGGPNFRAPPGDEPDAAVSERIRRRERFRIMIELAAYNHSRFIDDGGGRFVVKDNGPDFGYAIYKQNHNGNADGDSLFHGTKNKVWLVETIVGLEKESLLSKYAQTLNEEGGASIPPKTNLGRTGLGNSKSGSSGKAAL